MNLGSINQYYIYLSCVINIVQLQLKLVCFYNIWEQSPIASCEVFYSADRNRSSWLSWSRLSPEYSVGSGHESDMLQMEQRAPVNGMSQFNGG